MVNENAPPKTFVCHRCSRVFGRLEHLKRHENSHTNEKPFHCVVCNRPYTRKDLLARHFRLVHHGQQGGAPQGNRNARLMPRVVPASMTVAEVWPEDIAQSTVPAANNHRATIPCSSSTFVNSEERHLNSDNILGVTVPSQFALGSVPSIPSIPSIPSNDVSSTVPGLTQDFFLGLPLADSYLRSITPVFADDFSAFMDSVPGFSYPFSPTYQPLPALLNRLDPPLPIQLTTEINDDCREVEQRSASQNAAALPALDTGSLLSRYGSRLPSLQHANRPPHPGVPQYDLKLNNRHILVTAEFRQRLGDKLFESFGDCIDSSFTLPSRHALARYIGSYFKNFHNHYPFLHVPTLSMGDMNAELLLAIAALGARYTREQEIGNDLYNTARSVALERLRRRRASSLAMPPELRLEGRSVSSNEASRPSRPSRPESFTEPAGESEFQTLQLMQTLLLLIAIATWYKRDPAATDALSIRSVLHALTQEDDTRQKQAQHLDDWKTWARYETLKRTQLVIFCFFNIHTVLFDLPPMMLASGLNLELPCSEREWRAGTEQEWRDVGSGNMSNASRRDFQEAFVNLFINSGEPYKSSQIGSTGFSALAGCALIHAMIQQIWLLRNSRIPCQHQGQRNLSGEEIDTFELALKRWACYWERNQESSMDPLSPDGPVTFTSTALLRLAYIRLNMDLGPARSLSSWDPYTVARSLHRSATVRRNEKLTRAALHCAHALSIPIKLGINYVAQTQLIHWSNQHALCSLECALLLAKWLEEVNSPEPSLPLTISEKRVLDFVVQLVAETEYKLSCAQIMEQKARLSAMIVRLWARLYQSSSVWEMVNLIGKSLHIYADLLEAENL